jgi:cobalamin synthase
MNHRPLHRPTPTPRRPITDRPGRRLRRTVRRMAPAAAVVTSTAVAVALVAEPAYAAESLNQVIDNIRTWLLGILVAVATLFLTVGGLRYAAANGDPGEVEKAKLALKSAAIGYALAMLAPLFVTIVGQWVA